MNEHLAKRLFDAHRAAVKVETVTKDLTFSDYSSSALTRLAVERLLEIVGEAPGAVLRLDANLEEEHPDFRRAVSLRNRIIHGYDGVNNLATWDIARTNIPARVVQIEALRRDTPEIEDS